ncbi:DEKNAAC103697 [Brettanomyces naardenensis]|uniref:Holocytochrome c-type synthase n=1 Tax=Brettanomyces naardenensis TaxID=13370 RepID=A0A448YP05_BRENA|nr:DEKNAAC103697 [Brettanomyces naardenensis]
MGFFWADEPKKSSCCGPTCNCSHCRAKRDVPKFDPSSLGSCPVMKKQTSDGGCPRDNINPLNNMPMDLSSSRAPGQTIDLPTEKTKSSIPKGPDTTEGVWVYPSPQQMLNAMIRKGKGDVPEDAVESMVDIHNFLNEGAWSEILKWEKFHTQATDIEPRLQKFTGRPDQMSPKAKVFTTLGKYFPSRFSSAAPFDRHDWTVLRSDGRGGWSEVRYVIDYYAGPEDEDGLPTFYLDVRPALDNLGNARDRLRYWTQTEAKPVWDKAMGKT